MPEPFDISELDLPAGAEVSALLAAHPDIVPERFGNEELLIRGGDSGEDIFLLLHGACLVEAPGAPEERRPGDAMAVLQAEPDAPVFVGEMAYLGKSPRSAGVRSVMATCALRLKPAHLDAVMDSYPGLTRILCRQFTQRLRETNEQLHVLRGRMALHPEQIIIGAGELVCAADAPAERLYQLADGMLLREFGGEEDTIKPAADTPCFIEARSYFTRGVYAATYRAKTTAILLAHPAESREALACNFPEMVLQLLSE